MVFVGFFEPITHLRTQETPTKSPSLILDDVSNSGTMSTKEPTVSDKERKQMRIQLEKELKQKYDDKMRQKDKAWKKTKKGLEGQIADLEADQSNNPSNTNNSQGKGDEPLADAIKQLCEESRSRDERMNDLLQQQIASNKGLLSVHFII